MVNDFLLSATVRRLCARSWPTVAVGISQPSVRPPLPTGDLNSGPPGPSQSAQTIKLSPNIPEPFPGLRKALHRLKVRQDALVVRILARAGYIAGRIQHSLAARQG